MYVVCPQHLQIADKRTCWHGNAGGKLNADPKNVVSIVPSFSFRSSKLLKLCAAALKNKFCMCIFKTGCQLK